MFADQLDVGLIVVELLLVGALLLGVSGWLMVIRFLQLVGSIVAGTEIKVGPVSFTLGVKS